MVAARALSCALAALVTLGAKVVTGTTDTSAGPARRAIHPLSFAIPRHRKKDAPLRRPVRDDVHQVPECPWPQRSGDTHRRCRCIRDLLHQDIHGQNRCWGLQRASRVPSLSAHGRPDAARPGGASCIAACSFGGQPPRAVPWKDVRRILHAIYATAPTGLRDRALFLMMATYGVGAAEGIGLRLERCRLAIATPAASSPEDRCRHGVAPHGSRGSRPRCLPAPGRPSHASTRALFVSRHLPHGPLSGSTAIRHRLALYAGGAGIREGYLGSSARARCSRLLSATTEMSS
jgi:hypothetical protein